MSSADESKRNHLDLPRPICLLDFTTDPRYHFERVLDAYGVGGSFCSKFAGAAYPVHGEVLDEGADDALAFFHGTLCEEVAGVAEAFEDGVDQFGRVGRPGRDLFEGAQPALQLLSLTTVMRLSMWTAPLVRIWESVEVPRVAD